MTHRVRLSNGETLMLVERDNALALATLDKDGDIDMWLAESRGITVYCNSCEAGQYLALGLSDRTQWSVTLSNGQCLLLIEDENGLDVCLADTRTTPATVEAYLCTIKDAIAVMTNCGTACPRMVQGLKQDE